MIQETNISSIIDSLFDDIQKEVVEKAIKEYAKIKCKELLEIVVKNAEVYIPDGAWMDCYVNPNFIEIDASSILNAVDLETFC